MSGLVALVGGEEWSPGCEFDAELLNGSGRSDGEVVVLPAGAAYENPEKLVRRAVEWFSGLGATACGLDVLERRDAEDPQKVARVRDARFVYLAGESPLHLRSVLKATPLWEALLEAWHDGATVAGSSAGAMVLTDPMVDPRGGAFTVGLGMVSQLAVVPHYERWSGEKMHRTVALAGAGLFVVGIEDRTALVHDGHGTWTVKGAGGVEIWRDRSQVSLSELPG